MDKRKKLYVFALLAVALAALLLSGCASKGKSRKEQVEGEARAHYKLGVQALTQHKLQRAFVEFQRAIRMDPGKPQYYNALGLVHKELNDPEKAEQAFRDAVEVDEEYSEGYNNLCLLFYEQEMWERAEQNCKLALDNTMYTTPEKSFYLLGRIYYRMDRHDLAIESFEKTLNHVPGLPLAYYGLALAYNAQGNYGKAATALNRAISYDSLFEGNRNKAIETFRKKAREADSAEKAEDFQDLLMIFNY